MDEGSASQITNGRHTLFGFSCQQFLHSSLEMLHTEYGFWSRKRSTSTFASMYVKLWQQQATAYLIYLKWLLHLAILPWDEKAGLVTPPKCQCSKWSRRNVHLEVLFWSTPLHHLQPRLVLKERRTYRHSLAEVLKGGQRTAFTEKCNSKTRTLTVQHTAERVLTPAMQYSCFTHSY